MWGIALRVDVDDDLGKVDVALGGQFKDALTQLKDIIQRPRVLAGHGILGVHHQVNIVVVVEVSLLLGTNIAHLDVPKR